MLHAHKNVCISSVVIFRGIVQEQVAHCYIIALSEGNSEGKRQEDTLPLK